MLLLTFTGQLNAIVSNFIIPTFITIVIFGLIVLIHEFGHLIAAKKFGVFVEEFAIGMGPKLFGIQKNETLYSIRLLPLGGYCKMLGEDQAVDKKEFRAFNNKKVYERIIIILAGVFMNIVLALALQMIYTSLTRITLPVVESVVSGSPAEQVGLSHGDRILKLDGKKINLFQDISLILFESKGEPMDIIFKKESGEIIEKTITPSNSISEDKSFKIGFSALSKRSFFTQFTISDPNLRAKFIESYEKATIGEFFVNSYNSVIFNLKYIFYSIKMLFVGQLSVADLSGPIGIVNVVGETYNESIKNGFWQTFLSLTQLAIILSANLAIMNMLPLPALDGGRFIFLLIEALRGKPIDQEKEGIVHLIGFLFLMGLAVFVAYNDIINIIKK